jgi:hypothetical protein
MQLLLRPPYDVREGAPTRDQEQRARGGQCLDATKRNLQERRITAYGATELYHRYRAIRHDVFP